MASERSRKTTMLTVDTGTEHGESTRFYVLMIRGRGSGQRVREDLLVPDGEELRTTHRHENLGEAA